MPNGKRALALALGLFLYPLLPGAFLLQAEEGFSVSAEAGPLWVEDEGAALYWRSGLSFKTKERFHAAIALGQVISDLPWAEGAVLGGMGNLGFTMPRFGLDLSFGFFQHDFLSSETETFSVYNNGGQVFFIAAAAPVSFGEWSIVPSFLYGSGAWKGGSLYWFFGKPGIPALAACGLSLRYRKQHELAFRYLFMDMDILANDREHLFDSRLDGYAAYYRSSLEVSNLRLGGSLGWLYAGAGTDGALTASNQHHAYFPYNFYTIDGSLSLHAGFAAVNLKQVFSVFQYSAAIGALHVFQSSGSVDIHYKQKMLFGGQEAFDTISPDIEGIGAAFMLLDAGFSSVRLGKGKTALLSMGVKKIIVFPWGYEQFSGGSSGAQGPSDSASNELLKTALLSGWSLYAALHW